MKNNCTAPLLSRISILALNVIPFLVSNLG